MLPKPLNSVIFAAILLPLLAVFVNIAGLPLGGQDTSFLAAQIPTAPTVDICQDHTVNYDIELKSQHRLPLESENYFGGSSRSFSPALNVTDVRVDVFTSSASGQVNTTDCMNSLQLSLERFSLVIGSPLPPLLLTPDSCVRVGNSPNAVAIFEVPDIFSTSITASVKDPSTSNLSIVGTFTNGYFFATSRTSTPLNRTGTVTTSDGRKVIAELDTLNFQVSNLPPTGTIERISITTPLASQGYMMGAINTFHRSDNNQDGFFEESDRAGDVFVCVDADFNKVCDFEECAAAPSVPPSPPQTPPPVPTLSPFVDVEVQLQNLSCNPDDVFTYVLKKTNGPGQVLERSQLTCSQMTPLIFQVPSLDPTVSLIDFYTLSIQAPVQGQQVFHRFEVSTATFPPIRINTFTTPGSSSPITVLTPTVDANQVSLYAVELIETGVTSGQHYFLPLDTPCDVNSTTCSVTFAVDAGTYDSTIVTENGFVSLFGSQSVTSLPFNGGTTASPDFSQFSFLGQTTTPSPTTTGATTGTTSTGTTTGTATGTSGTTTTGGTGSQTTPTTGSLEISTQCGSDPQTNYFFSLLRKEQNGFAVEEEFFAPCSSIEAAPVTLSNIDFGLPYIITLIDGSQASRESGYTDIEEFELSSSVPLFRARLIPSDRVAQITVPTPVNDPFQSGLEIRVQRYDAGVSQEAYWKQVGDTGREIFHVNDQGEYYVEISYLGNTEGFRITDLNDPTQINDLSGFLVPLPSPPPVPPLPPIPPLVPPSIPPGTNLPGSALVPPTCTPGPCPTVDFELFANGAPLASADFSPFSITDGEQVYCEDNARITGQITCTFPRSGPNELILYVNVPGYSSPIVTVNVGVDRTFGPLHFRLFHMAELFYSQYLSHLRSQSLKVTDLKSFIDFAILNGY
jgi:hypothetical protein